MKPKKTLGQNFLTSGKAIFEIVKAGQIEKGEIVLEIGPGKGALTEKILESGAKVIAIEKDRELIPLLEEKFEKYIKSSDLKILEGDILETDVEEILHPLANSISANAGAASQWKDRLYKYKIVANIPYYITGAIIEKFLSAEDKPQKMILLVQKEVAERIIAKNKKESILSLSVKLYGSPRIIYRVSAGSFFPKPKVDSAIISIDILEKIGKDNKKIDKNLETKYFKIVKAAFSNKRKMMIGNLNRTIKNTDWDSIFNKLNIDKKVRAEDLEVEDFINISGHIC